MSFRRKRTTIAATGNAETSPLQAKEKSSHIQKAFELNVHKEACKKSSEKEQSQTPMVSQSTSTSLNLEKSSLQCGARTIQKSRELNIHNEPLKKTLGNGTPKNFVVFPTTRSIQNVKKLSQQFGAKSVLKSPSLFASNESGVSGDESGESPSHIQRALESTINQETLGKSSRIGCNLDYKVSPSIQFAPEVEKSLLQSCGKTVQHSHPQNSLIESNVCGHESRVNPSHIPKEPELNVQKEPLRKSLGKDQPQNFMVSPATHVAHGVEESSLKMGARSVQKSHTLNICSEPGASKHIDSVIPSHVQKQASDLNACKQPPQQSSGKERSQNVVASTPSHDVRNADMSSPQTEAGCSNMNNRQELPNKSNKIRRLRSMRSNSSTDIPDWQDDVVFDDVDEVRTIGMFLMFFNYEFAQFNF